MVKFISIHVPKTAGTSLGYLLDYGTCRRIFWDYPRRKFNFDSNDDYFLQHKDFMDQEFDVIHGHFKYEKYSKVFPDAKYLTCVRHPVQRVISQYKHILGEANEDNCWYKEIANGSMSVVDFAENYNIGNAHAVFLKGREIKDYDFVFITEKFPETFSLFQKLFNFKRCDEYSNGRGMPELNKGANRKNVSLDLTEDIFQAIYKRTHDDNEIYKQAIDMFQKKKNSCSELVKS